MTAFERQFDEAAAFARNPPYDGILHKAQNFCLYLTLTCLFVRIHVEVINIILEYLILYDLGSMALRYQ